MIVSNASNEKKLAASFCCQVAAWFPDMFCTFYIVKNHKIDNNLETIEAIAQICNPQNFRNFLMYD